MPFSLSEINKRVDEARLSLNSTLDKAGEKSGVFKPKPPPPPPSSKQSSSLGSRIEHARTSLNSTLDKAGQKTGVFKAPPPAPPSTGAGHRAGVLPAAATSNYRPPPPPPHRSQQSSVAPPSLPSRSSPEIGAEPKHEVARPALSAAASWRAREQATTASPAVDPSPPPYPQAIRTATPSSAGRQYPPISQFTPTDKQAFFDLMDEFFNRRNVNAESNRSASQTSEPMAPAIIASTRPGTSRTTSAAAELGLPMASYAGKSLAMWVVAYSNWPASDTNPPWYATGNPYPPPVLKSSSASGDLEAARRAAGWAQSGDHREAFGYVLYPDLSQCWFNISHSARSPWPPTSAESFYRPPPESGSSEELAWAADVYGSHTAEFAEQALANGQPIGRGECWDLAAEALKAFEFDPKPLPSTGRTHGVLLWRGSPGDGEWVGDEGRELGIRRGDIIEWRRAKCETVRPHKFATLGDPDHTAIITAAPETPLPDGALPPSLIGELTVVEQSLNALPSQATYNLATLSEGQVWIYRPFSEERLLGEGAEAKWPPHGDRLFRP